MTEDQIREIVNDCLSDFFIHTDSNPLENIEQSLRELMSCEYQKDIHEKHSELVSQTSNLLDRLDTLNKGFDRLNQMINEFKGVVSMARANFKSSEALKDRLDSIFK